MSVSKPPSNYTINSGDELGDVAFCVPVLEGSGNTVKEYVSGTTSSVDTVLGSNWSTIDGGVDWTGPCIDNTNATGTNRGAAAITFPAALTATGHLFSGTYAGPATSALLFKPVYSSTINQGLTNHLADLSGTGTATYGGYENNTTAGVIGNTIRNSGGSIISAGNSLFSFDSVTQPYIALIYTWPAGTSAGVTVYTNLDGSGLYTSSLRTVTTIATADYLQSLYVGSGTGINACGPWGGGTPRGFRGKFVSFMLWERVLTSQQRNDWLVNPWRMFQAPGGASTGGGLMTMGVGS